MVEEVTRQKLCERLAKVIGASFNTSRLDTRPVEDVLEALDDMGLCIMPKEATEEMHESMCEGWFKGDWEMPVAYAWAVPAFQRQLKGE